MTPQELLVAFMERKRLALINITGGSPEACAYFTDKDAEAIKGWSTLRCYNVIASIKNALPDVGFLGSDACPFCIYHAVNCSQCEYPRSRGHIKCRPRSSAYSRIFNQVNIPNREDRYEHQDHLLKQLRDWLLQFQPEAAEIAW